MRCDAGLLSEYGRALRRVVGEQAVGEAEREVGAAWSIELLKVRDVTLQQLEADQALLDVIAEELEAIAQAADERDRAVRAGRLRVAAARAAMYRPRRPG